MEVTVVQGAVTGVIKPPPQLRELVDITAEFVAKNGKAGEARISAKGDPKFDFLKPDHPFNRYYAEKVDEIALKIHRENTKESEKPEEEANAAGKDESEHKEETTVQTAIQEKEDDKQGKEDSEAEKNKDDVPVVVAAPPKVDIAAEVLKKKRDKPPPDYLFTIDHPIESERSVDLENIALTAKYAAVLGPQFVSDLAKKEQHNPGFQFLMPQNKLFSYFTSLVDSYQSVLDWKETVRKVEERFQDSLTILDRALHRVEWKRRQEEKEKESEHKTMEDIVSFNQIDWHDFALVGTIDFEEDVAAATPTAKAVGFSIPSPANASRPKQIDEDEDENDVEMDMSDDDESSSAVKRPLPRTNDEIKIKTDYKPKVATGVEKSTKITLSDGRVVEANDINEHVRVDLLDPKWREQRERFIQRQQTTNIVEADVAKNLNKMASHRPDVFGTDSRILPQTKKETAPPIVWDGSIMSVTDIKIASIEASLASQSSDSSPASRDYSIGPKQPEPRMQPPPLPKMVAPPNPPPMPPQPPPMPPQPPGSNVNDSTTRPRKKPRT